VEEHAAALTSPDANASTRAKLRFTGPSWHALVPNDDAGQTILEHPRPVDAPAVSGHPRSCQGTAMYLGTRAPDAAPWEFSTMDARSTVASMAAGGVRSAAPDVLNLQDG
jgi:hypothetical protein